MSSAVIRVTSSGLRSHAKNAAIFDRRALIALFFGGVARSVIQHWITTSVGHAASFMADPPAGLVVDGVARTVEAVGGAAGSGYAGSGASAGTSTIMCPMRPCSTM